MEATNIYPLDKAPRGDTVDQYKRADGSMADVQDPYRALEDPDAEGTKAWATAQNEITQAHLAKCEYRAGIEAQLTKVWNYPKLGLVNKKGDHYYFQYNTGLQNQFVQYRVKEKNTFRLNEDPLDGAEVFLDPNTLAEDGTASIAGRYWSDDGRYCTYAVQRAGSDWRTLYVRDAETREDVATKDEVKWAKFSGASWTKDSKGFFYSAFDAPANAGTGTDGKAGAAGADADAATSTSSLPPLSSASGIERIAPSRRARSSARVADDIVDAEVSRAGARRAPRRSPLQARARESATRKHASPRFSPPGWQPCHRGARSPLALPRRERPRRWAVTSPRSRTRPRRSEQTAAAH